MTSENARDVDVRGRDSIKPPDLHVADTRGLYILTGCCPAYIAGAIALLLSITALPRSRDNDL